jgi:alkylation response protein AidB-like acyl-CoA dehydrogenase
MIGATSGLVAAYMPEQVAKSLFQDESVIVAGVFAPRGTAQVDGNTYVVNGRWQWGSGSPNARLIMGGCMVTCDGQPVLLPNGMPESRMMMVPVEDAELHDNWDVSGLSGTGSQDFSIRDRRVPSDMSIGLLTDRPVPAPLYAFPVFGMLAAGVASVMIGIASSAIRELISIALAKTPEGHRKTLATRNRTQEDTAEAEALVRSARGFLHGTIEAAWDEAQGGAPLSTSSRRDIRLAATHAARASVRAVDLMYHLAGGTAVYRTSPLQRMFRDIHVAAQHMMVAPPTMETVGRLLLQQDTDTSQL